jgi:hypothetical protein
MLRVVLIAVLALSAGPAFAEFGTYRKPGGYGTFAPGRANPATSPPAPGAFGLPEPPAAAKIRPATPGGVAPPPATSPAFKAYEPWKPGSTTSLFGPDGRPTKK